MATDPAGKITVMARLRKAIADTYASYFGRS
jgi:hypothetical protein